MPDDEYGFWKESDGRSPTSRVAARAVPAAPNFVMRRIGVLLAIGLVAAPVAVVVGTGDGDHRHLVGGSADGGVVDGADLVPGTPPAPVTSAGTVAPMPVGGGGTTTSPALIATTALIPDATMLAPPSPSVTTRPPFTTSTERNETRAEDATASTAAVATRAAVDVATCANTYDVVAGDYWILIADRAGVRLADLLAINGVRADAALYPGHPICLPAGVTVQQPRPTSTDAIVDATSPATTIAPPPTTTPPPATSAPPATTVPPATTAPPTTAPPPATTAPPATTHAVATAVPVQSAYSRADVIQIIRDTWPDDLEDEAIRIATRESNLIPTVRNACCFGVFQLYWDVHKSWMGLAGVTSSDQLYDPHVNAYLAFAMYVRSGGWGPWR